MISSSVPLALARALEAGDIARGDEVQALVGSAGMVFTLTTFRL